MEETIRKRTTLCYCQNVYLITPVTLYLLFFLCFFPMAICDPYIEYKSSTEYLCSKEYNKETKNTAAIDTTSVQTIAKSVIYISLWMLYSFYCKVDFTVLP